MNSILRKYVPAATLFACLLVGGCGGGASSDGDGAGEGAGNSVAVDSVAVDSVVAPGAALNSVNRVAPDSVRANGVALADSVRANGVALADSARTPEEDLAAAVAALARAVEAYTESTQEDTTSAALNAAVLGEARGAARDYSVRIFWALVLFAFSYGIVVTLTWLLDRVAEASAKRRLLFKRLVPIARLLVWVMYAYIALKYVFDISAQNLFAAAAAIGVAVGFAAQDLLKNIFGGLVIISDRPFQVGDKISVGGTYGEVTSIGLRSTRIVTPDDNLVTVPNAQLVDTQVANANAGALDLQVVTHLYLPGFVDETNAKRIAYEAAASSKYVYRKKPIVVIVLDEFSETFITHLKVKAYVLDTRYELLLMSDITERARRGFRGAGLIKPGHGSRAWVPAGGPAVPDDTARGGMADG